MKVENELKKEEDEYYYSNSNSKNSKNSKNKKIYETYEKELFYEALKFPEKDTQVDVINLLLDLIPDSIISFRYTKFGKRKCGKVYRISGDVSWDVLKFLETQCKKSHSKDSDFSVNHLERLDDLFVRFFERGYIPSKSTAGITFRYLGEYGLIKSFLKAVDNSEIINDSKYSHYLNYSLDYAIQNEHIDFVKKLIDVHKKADKKIIDWERMTNEAAKGNSFELFKIVLQKIDVSDFERGKKLLETSCSDSSKRNPYIIEYMYKLSDIIGVALKWAIENGKYDIAHFYLKNDLNNLKTFKYGLEINSIGLTRLMLQDVRKGDEFSKIFVENESLLTREIIALFEVSPIDINVVDTILRWSVKNGEIELLKKMIKKKSEIMAKELARKEDSLDSMVIEYIKKNGCLPENVKFLRS